MFAKFLLSKASGYLAVAMGSLVLVLSVSLWINGKRLDHCKTNAAGLESSLATAVNANKSNKDTIATLRAENARNEAQRADVAARAAAAEARVDDLIKQINEVEPFETQDTNCRQLTDPLPADFMCWLRGSQGCN